MSHLPVFLSRPHTRYGAVFDVNSDSVGIALVASEEDELLPKVIFAHRVKMRLRQELNSPEERVKQMRETLFSASLIFSKDAIQALVAYDRKARIENILLVCASPWAFTLSKEVLYEGEENFEVTEELISDLALSAEREVDDTNHEQLIVTGAGFSVVERATTDVKINGYSVRQPIGLTGKNLSLSHVTGFVLREILDAMTEVRDKILTDATIHTHTSVFVTYCVLRDLFPETASSTLVSVTGESTEIGIVDRGVLLETHALLYGTHTLIRDIQSSTDQTPEYVVTMLRAYAEKKLNETAMNTLDSHAAIYTAKIEEVLRTIMNRRDIPTTLIIDTDPDLEPFVQSEVQKALSHLSKQSYKTIPLSHDLIANMAEYDGYNTRLAVEARFFHKLHGCGEFVTQ